MPFKIVQTKENGKIVLTIVPSKWEKNNKLFWPTRHRDINFIHDGESWPKPDWKEMDCIFKREFATIGEAENEVTAMEQASDTENTDTEPLRSFKPRSRPLYTTRQLQPINLNDQIRYQSPAEANVPNGEYVVDNTAATIIAFGEDTTHDSNNIPFSPAEANVPNGEYVVENTAATIIALGEDTTHDSNNIQFVSHLAPNKSASDSDSTSNLSEPSSTAACITYTQNQVLGKLLEYSATLKENQEKLIAQMAVLQSSVDYLMGKKLTPPNDDGLLNRLPIQPVNTKNDLDELEHKLTDENVYNNMVSEMTFICGNSGKCKGTDSCYKLVDYFFTREIFVHCNWTGSTRDIKADKKIPLKFYTRIRNCFFDIIRKSDVNFTENDADKFFKVVIKNARQRLNNKICSVARTSKPKQKKVLLKKPESDNALGTISEEQELKESEETN